MLNNLLPILHENYTIGLPNPSNIFVDAVVGYRLLVYKHCSFGKPICKLEVFATFKKHRVFKKLIAPGSDFDSFANAPADFRNPKYFKRQDERIKKALPDCDINAINHCNAMRVLKNGWNKSF